MRFDNYCYSICSDINKFRIMTNAINMCHRISSNKHNEFDLPAIYAYLLCV